MEHRITIVDDEGGQGCVVLDVRLPDLSGLNLQEKVADADIDLPIIFITGIGDIPMTGRAMKAGALEFLTKPINEQQLLDAMQRGIERHRRQLMGRGQMTELQTRYRSLTNRECQVFPLVANGYLNKQIAAELGASEKTVKIHRGSGHGKDESRFCDRPGAHGHHARSSFVTGHSGLAGILEVLTSKGAQDLPDS
jgi:FixJ family two-component response regulator